MLAILPSLQGDRDCEALRAELNRVAAQVREQEAAMEEHAAQISQLQGAIAEAEQVGREGSCRLVRRGAAICGSSRLWSKRRLAQPGCRCRLRGMGAMACAPCSPACRHAVQAAAAPCLAAHACRHG